jgi:hypothetical protein
MKSIPVAAAQPAADINYSVGLPYLSDLLARATIIVLFSLMALRFGNDFLVTGRITGLFLLLSEVLVVVLTLVRRPPSLVDRSLRARALTIVSILGPPLLVPGSAAALAPEAITVGASCVGLAIVIAGKITLGRSFALLPANRGVVSSGLYQIVRSPAPAPRPL